jgi:hypothetical protein
VRAKRTAAFFLSLLPWIAVAAGLGGLVYRQYRLLLSGQAGATQAVSHSCPIEVDAHLLSTSESGLQNWKIYAAGDDTPKVKVSSNLKTEGDRSAYCSLSFTGGRSKPSGSIDWRIGTHYHLPDAAEGRFVVARFKIRADRRVMLNTGSVYIYDGIAATATNVPTGNTGWENVSVKRQITQDSRFVEIWFRLAIGDGTIVPSDGRIDFTVAVALE